MNRNASSSAPADTSLVAATTCKHVHTGFHADNPSRFTCFDCKGYFADYGKGYQQVDKPTRFGILTNGYAGWVPND